MPRLWLVLAGPLLALMAFAATAQAPAPSADEEAMARARRQAENPLRRILEASRITVRRRVSADAPEAAASAVVSPAGVASGDRLASEDAVAPSGIRITVEPILPPRRGAAPAAITADVSVAQPSTPVRPAPLPAVGQGSGPPRAPEAVATPPAEADAARLAEDLPATPLPAPVFKTMEWAPDQPAATVSAPSQAVPANPPAVTSAPPGGPMASPQSPEPAVTVPAEMPETSAPALPSTPALRTMIEPALTDRLRDELGLVDVVSVDLTLATDGTVQDATFLTRVPIGVRRVLLSALLQWRYEALAQPTVHRVELAFER